MEGVGGGRKEGMRRKKGPFSFFFHKCMLNGIGKNEKERVDGKAARLVLWSGGDRFHKVQPATCNCIWKEERRD